MEEEEQQSVKDILKCYLYLKKIPMVECNDISTRNYKRRMLQKFVQETIVYDTLFLLTLDVL